MRQRWNHLTSSLHLHANTHTTVFPPTHTLCLCVCAIHSPRICSLQWSTFSTVEAGRHTTLPEQSPYSGAPRCILLTACCQHNHASTRCPHTCACPPPTSCAGVHENFDDMTTQEASKRIQARTKKHPTPPNLTSSRRTTTKAQCQRPKLLPQKSLPNS